MINKPIFIIGTSRSGTTILYNFLAVHPDVCWFSTISNAFPHVPQLAVIYKLLDVPFFGTLLKLHIMKTSKESDMILGPHEGPTIYDDLCGFTNARITTEHDKTDYLEKKLKAIIAEHLRATGRSRFLNKKPENIQRIRLLNAIFPNAYFVHIIRDGRAVANSLLKSYWWPDAELWWLNGLRSKDWDAQGRDPIELCALHWRHNVQEVFRNKQLLRSRYIEVRYESLVQDVRGTISPILTFCGLRQDKKHLALLPSRLPNMNYKWRKDLSPKQQAIVCRVLHKQLVKLQYEQE